MANLGAQRKQQKRVKQTQEDRANRKNAKYPLLKENKEEPATFSLLTPHQHLWPGSVHLWGPDGRLKKPAICRRAQYGEVECKWCSKDGTYGPLRPTDVHGYLSFVHNKYKRKWTDPRTKKTTVVRHLNIILLEAGKEDANWEKIQEAIDEKKFKRSVFQLKLKKPLRIIGQEAKDALRTKGIVPEADRQEADLTVDEFWAHVANVVDEFDYDWWGVEEIVVPFNKEDNAPSGKYADEDDEDEEEDDEDEDSDDEEKPRKKVAKPAPKKPVKKKPVVDDDEDDEESEDEDDEEDEAPPPRKKKPVAKKAPAKPTKKKAHWSNSSDDEDDDEDDSEDDDEE